MEGRSSRPGAFVADRLGKSGLCDVGRSAEWRCDAGGLPNARVQSPLLTIGTNGKLLWQKTATVAKPHQKTHETNGFASASPCTDGEHVYAHFGSRGLFCYSMNGDLVWKRDDFGKMETLERLWRREFADARRGQDPRPLGSPRSVRSLCAQQADRRDDLEGRSPGADVLGDSAGRRTCAARNKSS